MAKADLTVERLRELLDYNPETGIFTWRVDRSYRIKANDRAGYVTPAQGYRKLTVLRYEYPEHRLAWFYVYGVWPSGDIDHINGIVADNRLANLRDVTTQEKCMNRRKARSDSTSGLIGAKKWHGKWQATIKADGRYIYLGTFDTPEEAHQAYVEAKRKLHPTCTI